MSVICLSWKSLGADWVISLSSSTNFASTPLKSKRVESSRLAWSTALVSSWMLTSETTSKEGMGEFLVPDAEFYRAPASGTAPGGGTRVARHSPASRQTVSHASRGTTQLHHNRVAISAGEGASPPAMASGNDRRKRIGASVTA